MNPSRGIILLLFGAAGVANGADSDDTCSMLQTGKVSTQEQSLTDAADPKTEKIFDHIYAAHKWGSAGGGSGEGSRKSGTRTTQKILLDVIKGNKVGVLADVPCGMMEWTSGFLQDAWKQHPDLQYVGADITSAVVEHVREKHATEKSRTTFVKADMADEKEFPGVQGAIATALDRLGPGVPGQNILMLTRDALQHISDANICSFFTLMKKYSQESLEQKDRALFLLVGSYPSGYKGAASANHDIHDGQHRLPNFLEDPWGPLFLDTGAVLADFDESNQGKHLLLVDVAKMKMPDCSAF